MRPLTLNLSSSRSCSAKAASPRRSVTCPLLCPPSGSGPFDPLCSPSSPQPYAAPLPYSMMPLIQTTKRPADSTIGELKAEVEARLQIPPAQMKLLCAGKALRDDAMSLRQFGLKKGSKVMLLGTKWVPGTAWVHRVFMGSV